MAISMLKIRRPLERLIFNMGIAIPGKTVFLIETAPCVAFIVDETLHAPMKYATCFAVVYFVVVILLIFILDRQFRDPRSAVLFQ